MLPDPDAVDALGVRAGALADELRASADRLQRQAAGIAWVSSAATSFAEQADEQLRSLRRTAEDLDGAADDLHRHAAAL